MTDNYDKANADRGDESYIESYYRRGVTECFGVSGNVQWVKNAFL